MAKSLITPRAFYRTLHRIADGRIGAVERTFLTAIKSTSAAVNVDNLRKALREQSVFAVFAAIDLDGQLEPRIRNEYARILQSVFMKAGVAAEQQFPTTVNLRFDLANPRATRWARDNAAQLVVNVGEDVRANIRLIVSRGFRQGRTVDTMAREIMTSGIGPTAKQGVAIENRRTGLELRYRVQQGATLEDAAAEMGLTVDAARAYRDQSYEIAGRSVDLDAELIEARAEKYAERQVRYRARVIARTETIAASSNGQQEIWRQAADKGLIDVGTTRREWIITEDDRLCPICAAIPEMNSDGVALNEPFATPEGPVLVPPVHPQCRCAVALRFVAAEQRQSEAA